MTRNFVPLVIDYDAQPQLFKKPGGRGLPFNVVMSPQGQVLDSFVGLLNVSDLLSLLSKFEEKIISENKPVSQFNMIEPVVITSLDNTAYQNFREAFLDHLEAFYSTQRRALAIAWIASHPGYAKQDNPLLPAHYTHWAMQQINLHSDTAPDSLIFALRACENYLEIN